MSNEEIVIRIQAREDNLCSVLWEQVEKLAAWKARRVIRALEGYYGVEFGDLYNACYPAMLDAVRTYNPATGAFATWFMYYIKTAFATETGYRTEKARQDPLRQAVSLSRPLGETQDDGILADVIPDAGAQLRMEAVEEKLWHDQLHEALETVLSEIPENQSRVLRCRYYEGLTQAVTAQRLNISPAEARKFEGQGLKALRYHKLAAKIRPFYDFDYCRG